MPDTQLPTVPEGAMKAAIDRIRNLLVRHRASHESWSNARANGLDKDNPDAGDEAFHRHVMAEYEAVIADVDFIASHEAKELKELREALEWYAQRDVWIVDDIEVGENDGTPDFKRTTLASIDGGKRARAAIRKEPHER